MKSLFIENVLRYADHKYLMLAAGALGIAYYVGSHLMRPNAPKLYPAEMHEIMAQANNCLFEKKYQDAIRLYDQIIAYDARCSAAHCNKGQALLYREQWPEACHSYEMALSCGIRPETAPLIYLNYGIVLYRCKRYEHACDALTKSLKYAPTANAYAQRALANEELGKLDEAYADIKKACEISFEQSYGTALIKIGNSFRDTNDFEKARLCYQDALTYMPAKADFYLNLADVLHLQSKKVHDPVLFDEAIATYKKAYELDPQLHLAYHNLACMFYERDDETQALAYTEKVFALVPDFCPTDLFLSCLYLRNGNFEQGWRRYDRRLETPNPTRHAKNPRWNGSSSLAGKTILLQSEQGFGDAFHFVRYAKLMRQHHPAKIIVEVLQPIKKLISLIPYIDEVIGSNDPIPAYDLQVELMSLPHLMKTRLESIPREIPYLYAAPHLVSLWADHLKDDHGFKIGICWQVEPTHDRMQYHNNNVVLTVMTPWRSFPVAHFSQVLDVPSVSLYSLQKKVNESDSTLLTTMKIHTFDGDYDKTHGSFMDTAAIMENINLVITADTSIAHLAGGLGVPVWIMLPYDAEWRWLKDRSDSPWYPTARLFRQKKAGDWDDVFREVKTELQRLLATHHTIS